MQLLENCQIATQLEGNRRHNENITLSIYEISFFILGSVITFS